jgi:hypothetical protein
MRLVQILRILLDNLFEPVRWEQLQLIRFQAVQQLVIASLSDLFVFLETFESFQFIGHSVFEEA